jgi:hypothetical protein
MRSRGRINAPTAADRVLESIPNGSTASLGELPFFFCDVTTSIVGGRATDASNVVAIVSARNAEAWLGPGRHGRFSPARAFCEAASISYLLEPFRSESRLISIGRIRLLDRNRRRIREAGAVSSWPWHRWCTRNP